MAKPKEVTREEAARKKSQAAAFMERIGQSERAEEFQAMSLPEYAEHKGLRLTNPPRRVAMPQPRQSGPTKADLQDTLDSAIEMLDDAYQPESTREELATAVGNALDVLRGEDTDEDTADEEAEDLDSDADDDPDDDPDDDDTDQD